MIITLAGRRIDAPDAEEKRFPLATKETVSARIRDFLRRYNVRILVSSAACGADLLAQKAAHELEIERRIILPFDRKKFRETSVTDRPGDWRKLFDELCDEAEREGNLVILEGFEDDEGKAYSAVTAKLIEFAENLQTSAEKLLAVAVWEGKTKDETDETDSFIRQAKTKNIEVKEISTK